MHVFVYTECKGQNVQCFFSYLCPVFLSVKRKKSKYEIIFIIVENHIYRVGIIGIYHHFQLYGDYHTCWGKKTQARTWICNVICCGLFFVQRVQLRWEVIVRFVDIGGNDDHHCLNFLFIKNVITHIRCIRFVVWCPRSWQHGYSATQL